MRYKTHPSHDARPHFLIDIAKDISTVTLSSIDPRVIMGRARSTGKKPQHEDRDDNVSEPYSDELDVSSPEFLELGDDGEVVMNSDWNPRNAKNRKTKASNSQESDGEHNGTADDAV